jgi:hypothetical protein
MLLVPVQRPAPATPTGKENVKKVRTFCTFTANEAVGVIVGVKVAEDEKVVGVDGDGVRVGSMLLVAEKEPVIEGDTVDEEVVLAVTEVDAVSLEVSDGDNVSLAVTLADSDPEPV